MTPQEIFEYKLRWTERHPVAVHSDREHDATSWCKKNVEKHLWDMTQYTDIYEHTYEFRFKEHSIMLENYLRGENG